MEASRIAPPRPALLALIRALPWCDWPTTEAMLATCRAMWAIRSAEPLWHEYYIRQYATLIIYRNLRHYNTISPVIAPSWFDACRAMAALLATGVTDPADLALFSADNGIFDAFWIAHDSLCAAWEASIRPARGRSLAARYDGFVSYVRYLAELMERLSRRPSPRICESLRANSYWIPFSAAKPAICRALDSGDFRAAGRFLQGALAGAFPAKSRPSEGGFWAGVARWWRERRNRPENAGRNRPKTPLDEERPLLINAE